MVGDSNEWYIFFSPESAYTYVYTINGDTILDGQAYKPLETENAREPLGYIREDTSERQVYIRLTLTSEPTEIILFDFSLETGDTIRLYSFDYRDLGLYEVDSIGVINTLMGGRKAIYLASTEWLWAKPVWVEGIGSLGGIEYRSEAPSPGYGELSCFFKNGIKEYQSEFSLDLDNCIIGWSDIRREESDTGLLIYPNPASSEVMLEVSSSQPYQVSIIDINGRIHRIGEDLERIDLHDVPKGIYILKLEFSDHSLYRKLLIE
jgi:hypothetical protein